MLTRRYGIALTGFAAVFALLAITPASASFLPASQADTPVLFGMAELVHKNVDGEVLSSHTVHNQLVDYGESILIKGTFGVDSVGTTSNFERSMVLCVTDALTGADISDTTIAGDLTPTTAVDDGDQSCIDATVLLNSEPGSAVLNTEPGLAVLNATFDGDDVVDDAVITAIAVCNTLNEDFNDRDDCQASGGLFSAVGVVNTTIGADDTLDITYTFDIRSPIN
ncbi:hypothetical protein CENSYa_0592 [Cenarchaeum symbiosum A]|uniref:Uncharacterized protein n=1 Tax=Cenarchaeum symbiosum (strain A) TaxID=414004 RepID=A0RV58_CENSY|nr:hypothetical protein CENSYa_0592 [Cenarchaeum symbiosum A]